MKLMHKVSAASLTAATYLSLALPAWAQNLDPCDSTQGKFTNLCTSAEDASGLIGRVITAIFIIAAVIALFFLIWGGIKWILSAGDKAKVEAARGTIIAAIVGLIITFLAYFIMNFVLGLFGLGLSDLQLPTITGGGGSAVNSDGVDRDRCLENPNLPQCG